MSLLNEVQITHFRNISSINLPLARHLTLLYGANGSGKTSLLEAIYHLSAGHSFRSKLISDVVQHQQRQFTVFAELINGETLALNKQRNGKVIAKHNRLPVNSIAEFAKKLPGAVIYQDVFNIIDGGPSVRRQLLDWGLFHVEQSYFSLWKCYRKTLLQRNVALKQKKNAFIWDNQLCNYGYKLHLLRNDFLYKLKPLFIEYHQHLGNLNVDIDYKSGWMKPEIASVETLLKSLFECRSRDLQLGFSHRGAHKADLPITAEDLTTKNRLSRGQQKLVLLALKLALAALLNKPIVLLIDDLAAELDKDNLQKVIHFLNQQPHQFVISCLDTSVSLYEKEVQKMFRVKQGELV
jgi:DNA replication and repair protein RecF